MPDFWAIIPARRASTRLPDKPLADIHGKPMVVRVAERAAASGANAVIVATDDQEIARTAQRHGFESVLTQASHPSGTDRIAEVLRLKHAHADQIAVNVQGDEPMIEPELIAAVAGLLSANPSASVATAASALHEPELIQNPNIVKVVCDARSRALYFSRASIPYARDQQTCSALRHIGIYGFRARSLAAFISWPPCALEQTEQLEQLRWLWHGHEIVVHMVQRTASQGVDTADDLARVRQEWKPVGFESL